MKPLTDTEKELYENLFFDLRRIYQNGVAWSDNGIPFRQHIETFMKDLYRTDPINKQMLEAYYRYRLEIKHLLSQQPKLKDYFSEATQVEVRLREPFEAIIKAAKEEEGDT